VKAAAHPFVLRGFPSTMGARATRPSRDRDMTESGLILMRAPIGERQSYDALCGGD